MFNLVVYNITIIIIHCYNFLKLVYSEKVIVHEYDSYQGEFHALLMCRFVLVKILDLIHNELVLLKYYELIFITLDLV